MSSLVPAAAPARSSTPAKPPSPPLVRIEAHYRRALIRRWFDLNIRGLVWCVAVVGGIIVLRAGSASVLLFAIVGATGCYVLGVYPVLAAQRSLLIAPSTAAPHTAPLPSAVSLISAAGRIRLILANLVSAFVFSTTYCFILTLADGAKDLLPLSPTPRHPWHLNERFLYLITGSFLLSLCLSIQDSLTGTTVMEWPRRKEPLYLRVQQSIWNAIPGLDDWVLPTRLPSVKVAVAWSIAQYIVYSAIRRRLWLWLILNTGSFVRPFAVNFTRSKTSVGFDVVLHLMSISIMTITAVQLPRSMLVAYITQSFDFNAFTRKSPLGEDKYILTALHTTNAYHKHFTLMELARASHIPHRRKAIFADISTRSGSATLTAELWSALLLEFGRQYQTLSTRGGSIRTVSSVAPRAAPIKDERSMAVKTSSDIFRPVVRQRSGFGSSLQGMLDGTPRAAPPAVHNISVAAKQVEQKALQRAQGIEGQLLGRLDSNPAGHVVLAEAKGLSQRVSRWTSRRWAQNTVRRAMPQSEIIRWILEIFATLTVASAEEDTYGHVQQVLPATLEAMVLMHRALSNLESEVAAQAQSMGRSGKIAVQEAKVLLDPVQRACERAVLRIGERFGKSLSAFRFPPHIAAGLNEMSRSLLHIEEAQSQDQGQPAKEREQEMTQINR